MNGRKPYGLTLGDLRNYCKLLAAIEVIGGGSKSEALIGKNAAGEIVVRVEGKVTPAKVTKFRDSYQSAVAAGIIKRFTPQGQERHG